MRASKIYKPISVRAAKFFFMIADLVKLNNLYQFTHEWFLAIFVRLVREFPWSIYKNKEKALLKLRKKMTKTLFTEVCQTLFEKDIPLFAFLLAY